MQDISLFTSAVSYQRVCLQMSSENPGPINIEVRETDGQTEWQTDRQKDRETDGQTERQRDRQ